MTCNCDSVYQTVRTEISPSTFAAIRTEYMENRKGVEQYEWKRNSNNLIEYITVDQSAYQKHNYFKYKNKLKLDPNITVEDIENNIVKLTYNCVLTISVDRCLNCHTISEQYQQLIDTTQVSECPVDSEKQVCANSPL